MTRSGEVLPRDIERLLTTVLVFVNGRPGQNLSEPARKEHMEVAVNSGTPVFLKDIAGLYSSTGKPKSERWPCIGRCFQILIDTLSQGPSQL